MREIWITNETEPRVLFVKGRSAIDPDCLVAYAEGESKPLWIVDDGGNHGPVCGLGGDVQARKVVTPTPVRPAPDASEGRG